MGLIPRELAARVRLALQERRRRDRLWSAMARAVQPPPPHAFGTWGEGSLLVPPARVDNPQFMHVGSHVLVHEMSWLITQPVDGRTPRLEIGDSVRMQRFVKIVCTGSVTIGRGAVIGDHVSISDTSYRHDDPDRAIADQGFSEPLPVRIGAEVLLGFGAIVLPGVTIGEHASIGAGAVVVEDVPPRGVVVGNPGRLVRAFDETTRTWQRVTPAEESPPAGV